MPVFSNAQNCNYGHGLIRKQSAMQRQPRKAAAGGCFSHVMFLAIALCLMAACAPRQVVPVSLDEATARLEGGLRVELPDGPGPFPTILYFHGASDLAWHPGQQEILKGFAARGFAAVFVDLYHSRGIDGPAVRAGALLPRGAAGDVAIAVDWARRQAWAAPGRIGLFGISFGAATIMDALVYETPGRLPPGLKSKPSEGLRGVGAIALLAPWCAGDIMGFNLLRAVHEDFALEIPTLAVLPGADTISDQALCKKILARNRGNGAPIEIVPVAGAGHNFAIARDDYGNAFDDFDPGKSAAAWKRIYQFFKPRLQ